MREVRVDGGVGMTNPTRPYRVVDDEHGVRLEGPLNQPADLVDVADPDGFCEFVNDVFEMGYRTGATTLATIMADELGCVHPRSDGVQ